MTYLHCIGELPTGLTLAHPLLPQYLKELGYTTRIVGNISNTTRIVGNISNTTPTPYLHQGSGTLASATPPTFLLTGVATTLPFLLQDTNLPTEGLTPTMASGMLKKTTGGMAI